MVDASDFVYFDEQVSVLEDTIISVDSNNSLITLNGTYDDHAVTKLGDGAICGNNNIVQLIIGEGIETIGHFAISECRNLRQISLPCSFKNGMSEAINNLPALERIFLNRRVTKRELELIKKRAINIGVNEYILCNPKVNAVLFSDIEIACDKLASFAGMVSKEMGGIFCESKRDIYSQKKHYSFFGGVEAISENDNFIKLINSEYTEFEDASSEEENDRYMKSKSTIPTDNTFIVKFDLSNLRQDGNDYIMCFECELGLFFFQSAKKISFGNNNYYVYRKHYLSGNPRCFFFRKFEAVYDNTGILKNDILSEDIMAKHNLLACL